MCSSSAISVWTCVNGPWAAEKARKSAIEMQVHKIGCWFDEHLYHLFAIVSFQDTGWQITLNIIKVLCFFLFADLNSVSSRGTEEIRIRPFAFLSSPFCLWKQQHLCKLFPLHPTLFCFTCPSHNESNCLFTLHILITTALKTAAACSMAENVTPLLLFLFQVKNTFLCPLMLTKKNKVSSCSHYMIHLRELLIDLKTNIAWLIITTLQLGQYGVCRSFWGYFQDLVNRGIRLT